MREFLNRLTRRRQPLSQHERYVAFLKSRGITYVDPAEYPVYFSPQIEAKTNPEAVAAHLKEVAARGPIRFDDPRHGALHGTSLERVQEMIATGANPGRTQTDRLEDMLQGDLFLLPTPHFPLEQAAVRPTYSRTRLVSRDSESMQDNGDFAKVRIGDFAERHARAHAMIRELGLSMASSADFDRAMRTFYARLNELEGRTYFSGTEDNQDTFYKATVNQAVDVAMNRKGFMLAISPSIVEDKRFMFLEGDPGKDDMRIRTYGIGLPYRYISGIEPLGPVEAEFLDHLAK